MKRLSFLFFLLLLTAGSCTDDAEIIPNDVNPNFIILPPLDLPYRTLNPRHYSPNIVSSSYSALSNHISEGVNVFAFHPGGGWILVTKEGNILHENIPSECVSIVSQYINLGHEIRAIAFPPSALTVGANKWVVVTDKSKYARNIPYSLYSKLNTYIASGYNIRSVAFGYESDFDESWVIIADEKMDAQQVDPELIQILKNHYNVATIGGNLKTKRLHHIAFEPDGGWVILGRDIKIAKNIGYDPNRVLDLYKKYGYETSIIAFDPDGNGYSAIVNYKYIGTQPKDKIQQFESSIVTQDGTKTIWEAMKYHHVPGVAVALVIDNKIVWATSYGHTNEDEEHAIAPETLFQAASISKPITAIGIHRLIDMGIGITSTTDIQNKLATPIPVRDGITTSPPVTVYDVLNHKSPIIGRGTTLPETAIDSGFTDGEGGEVNGYNVTSGFLDGSDPSYIPSLDDIINKEGDSIDYKIEISLSATPLTSHYSGQGYIMLQKLIEDLPLTPSGDFAQWMHANILSPIGMNDSFFGCIVPQSKIDANLVASGHDNDGNQIDSRAGSGKGYGRRCYPQYAAAGLYTNVLDLSRVIIMLNNNGNAIDNLGHNIPVLSLAQRDDLIKGVGFIRSTTATQGHAVYYHGGSNYGWKSLFAGFPNLNKASESSAGIVVLTNGNDDHETANGKVCGAAFRYQIYRAVRDAYGW